MGKRIIRVAHSPDSDDAFMFYALATGKLETGEFKFVHQLEDIETLNQAARRGKYEVTAVSIHAFAYLQDKYVLLNSGASMGEGYGPVVISREPLEAERLEEVRVAVPGPLTSAYLALKLHSPGVRTVSLRFDRILPAVLAGEVEAGLLIHEGQLMYRELGCHRVLDLGEWWKEETGLPLPLGGNAIRRDLGPEQIHRISQLLRRSIQYALEHREEALPYSLQFGRGLDRERGWRFISMYVNDRTLDYGEEGRRAVQLFLDRGHQAGVLPAPVKVEFV